MSQPYSFVKGLRKAKTAKEDSKATATTVVDMVIAYLNAGRKIEPCKTEKAEAKVEKVLRKVLTWVGKDTAKVRKVAMARVKARLMRMVSVPLKMGARGAIMEAPQDRLVGRGRLACRN